MILLEDVHTPFGHIQITQSKRDGIYTYLQNDCYHSQANQDGVSTCGYVHVMHQAIVQSRAKRVLLLGCAGGSLATMLARDGCQMTVVDINDYAFTLAKRYFQMPDSVRCVVGDGVEYLRKTERLFDAVAIDVFDGRGMVPKEFTTEAFFALARTALAEKGLVMMNVMLESQTDPIADRIASNIQKAGLPAILFDQPGKANHNCIIVAGTLAGIQIPSGKEPDWIWPDIRRFARRAVKVVK